MYEETWDCYPDVKTVLTNGYKRLDGKFTISIHTIHRPGASMDDDPHKDNKKDIKEKDLSIVENDILTGGNKENDVTAFQSQKTGRGKLTEDWIEKAVKASEIPLMCCYTLVEIRFEVFGLQSKIEKILSGAVQNIIKDHYRKLFCTIDLWYDLSLDTIWDILEDKEKYKVKGVEDAIAKLAIASK